MTIHRAMVFSSAHPVGWEVLQSWPKIVRRVLQEQVALKDRLGVVCAQRESTGTSDHLMAGLMTH